MRLVLFFVCLCTFLLKADTGAYACTDNQNNYYSFYQEALKDDAAYAESVSPDNYPPVLYSNSGADFKDIYVLDEDSDDDDSDNFPAPVYRFSSAIKASGTHLSYASLLSHRTNYYGSTHAATGQQGDRYLMLGVLRI